jgi:hypothetical protein
MPSKKSRASTANPVGRPSLYRKEYCEQLIEYQRQGGSYQGFAGVIGVTIPTLYEWEENHEEFSYAKKLGKAANRAYMDNIAKGMMEGRIKGHIVAWLFLMKNYHGLQNDPLPDIEDQAKIEIEFKDGES